MPTHHSSPAAGCQLWHLHTPTLPHHKKRAEHVSMTETWNVSMSRFACHARHVLYVMSHTHVKNTTKIHLHTTSLYSNEWLQMHQMWWSQCCTVLKITSGLCTNAIDSSEASFTKPQIEDSIRSIAIPTGSAAELWILASNARLQHESVMLQNNAQLQMHIIACKGLLLVHEHQHLLQVCSIIQAC